MPGSPASKIDFQLVRATDLHAAPWKNGGGATREIAVEPPGAAFDSFLWRVSMADVAQPGPFSSFTGIDRIIVLLQGGSMVLIDSTSGARHVLHHAEPLRFAGEAPIHAELPDGATRDFNLMWRRDRAQGQLDVRRTAQHLNLDAGSTILHCASGAFRVSCSSDASQNWQLETGDTLFLTLNDAATFSLDIKPLNDDAVLLDSRIRALPINATRQELRP